ncbi:MAG: cytochrome c [Planctomycetes bacterium]|nr:cytochrome c [Planctomycetota bacterium]
MIDKKLNAVIDQQVRMADKTKDILVEAHETYPARAWIGLGALLGAIGCALVAGYLLRDYGERNIEYMPDMGYSEAWESQLKNDYREDYAKYTPELPPYVAAWGTAEMPPPPGTIYRGQQKLDIPSGDEGRAQAGRELTNPYANASGKDLDEVLKRGKALFRMNCQGCHGVDGVGNAPVTKYGIGAPQLANQTVSQKYRDGEFFHIITYGINTMPAHANRVNYDDRWIVIRYLRELQKGK